MQANTPRERRVFKTLKESGYAHHLVPNDPYGSHFISVMNIIFPSGERGFIKVLGQARYLVKDVELQHRIAISCVKKHNTQEHTQSPRSIRRSAASTQLERLTLQRRWYVSCLVTRALNHTHF